ncbi:chromate transporter [Acinetobacter sp. ANC 4558]|uniref:chromate transporter n=1 Tax=Acinetobacter sp. ANC 4558 TaxID=1977876 RepID=UPI000A338016|nr:chromate transporter [Acinetobacter sp. ANC 4558]OTG85882.1 chromate transporter [Acinetobacter sp. ANC 4558]
MILFTLALVFTQLSLLAFGGGNAILPEMQHQVVEVHQWLTRTEFSSMFAMAQAAPGPNMMIVPLLGWHVAGPAGLLVTSLAKFGPSSILAISALKLWNNFKDHPLRERFETALKPITVGLILVSAYIIADASAQNWLLIAIVIVTTLMSVLKKIHPLWIMAVGAATGILFL